MKTPGFLALSLFALCVNAANMPPRNPYLADSSYSMAHADPAQQDAVMQAGPSGPSTTLAPGQIDYVHVGPGHFGTTISGKYVDGKRVYWGNGVDRIVKIDYDTFEIIDEYFFPGTTVYTQEEADEAIAGFDESNVGFYAMFRAFLQMLNLRDLANLYTVLDRDHAYYIGSRDGVIRVFGDADPADSRSAIVKRGEYAFPQEVTGPVMGLNMTYDGWLVALTEHGYLVLVSRDLKQHRLTRLHHSEGAEDKATGPTGRGWIRNGPALDNDGGIYIVSQAHMHKVVWDGDNLSTDPDDGAWTSAYPNDWSHGSGATPALMGFGDEDRLVVITDGQPQMNVLAFWRDDIPTGWEGMGDNLDPRIAGMQLVTMDNPDIKEIQSEQSVVVAGYNALVVNNQPRNIPWYAPARAQGILIGLLGSNPRYQPYGVQNFRWNPGKRQLEPAWVNRKVSSPSSVPIISVSSNTVYLIGARDNSFTLEAIDMASGEERFHYVIGGQRYNVMFAGTMIDEHGRIHYGTPWGRVRIKHRGQISQ